MRPFKYIRPTDPVLAGHACAATTAKYLGGGTNLLDLMKEDVERPGVLVDVTRLALARIARLEDDKSDLLLGALAKNTAVANHPLVRQCYPLLSQAILAGASAQIRNMATIGGNLNQRTRCPYFYDTALPCNKRVPASGCGALEGINRNHAIFGWSEYCVATHPSDLCVALLALNATVRVGSAAGEERVIAFGDYHRLPGDRPDRDNVLEHGDLITAVVVPPNHLADHSCYLKVRERTSYAFALVSVAAALELDGDIIKDVRIALGGVAHKPWRALQAEQQLIGRVGSAANFAAAAAAEMSQAIPLRHNAYKIKLGRRLIVRALQTAMEGTGGLVKNQESKELLGDR